MSKAWLRSFVAIVPLTLLGAVVWALTRPSLAALPPTVADLSVVHAGVRVNGVTRIGLTRLSAGDRIESDAEGRARLRLDDGTLGVLDRDTLVIVQELGLEVQRGRALVVGTIQGRTRLAVAGASMLVGNARIGVERAGGPAKVYAANEDLVVAFQERDHELRAGNSALIGERLELRPERAFEDWTHGLAAPFGPSGAPRRAVGEMWARPEGQKPGTASAPLTLRSLDVRVSVLGEAAITKTTTTFFNGGSDTVRGDFRMALPKHALVSRVAWGGASLSEGKLALAQRKQATLEPAGPLLEWAGDGYVRGSLPHIASGKTMSVVVEYVEWLDRAPGDGATRVQYRYPFAASDDPPLIGELSMTVDARQAQPRSIASGFGAVAEQGVISIRRSDFRPTADLVVDLELPPFPAAARLYLTPDESDEPLRTLLVRTEVPELPSGDGARLALVLDVSGSSAGGGIETARAFVEAVLAGLSSRDHVAVLAAHQDVSAVGPATAGALDEERKRRILDGLFRLTPGGATDLGRALEAGADALGSEGGLVVYVGDGFATVGDPQAQEMLARLSRRASPMPRLGAVAVGPLANLSGLLALTRGSGPLLTVTDKTEAASAAIEICADALKPTLSAVELGFGPEVEQIYPRTARSVVAGSTITSVARIRGAPPSAVVLRWRDARGRHEERRLLSLSSGVVPEDVKRRWAAARVEEVLLTGRGREAVTDVASSAGLLTPWTGFSESGGMYEPSVLEARVLDPAFGEGPIGAGVATPPRALGALESVGDAEPGSGGETALKWAVLDAARRVLARAAPGVHACRSARAALRPELSGKLAISFELDGSGHAHDVSVRGATASAHDGALGRCVEVLVRGLEFPRSGLDVRISVQSELSLPPPPPLTRKQCSTTLPLALRRGAWRARLEEDSPAAVFVAARQSCELSGFTAERVLLELILAKEQEGGARLAIAQELSAVGHEAAAAYLRREAVRRAQSPEELTRLRLALAGSERIPRKLFEKRYRAAKGPRARLAVLRDFLSIAPHSAELLRLKLLSLEELKDKPALLEQVRRLREDPFAQAELLADAAMVLERVGERSEARRTFGEIAERAPADPWARALLGDRLRARGDWDGATRSYEALLLLSPGDPSALIRLALAHWGAGRVDVARRLLRSVGESGGRDGGEELSRLAFDLAGVVIADSSRRERVGEGELAALRAAALELPQRERQVVVLVRAPGGGAKLDARLKRPSGRESERIEPRVDAPGLGIVAFAYDAGSAGVTLELSRDAALPPARPLALVVDMLVPGEPGKLPQLLRQRVALPADGKWTAISLAAASNAESRQN